MQFREKQNTSGTILSVQHLSRGRVVRTIDDQHRLWPDYQNHKSQGILADPIIIPDPVEPTLEENKETRINEIDSRSQELLASGFTYNSATFSMAEKEQTRWKEMLLASNAGLLTYPITIYDINKVGHDLADSTAVTTFCGAFMQAREGILVPGRTLKAQIQAAADQTELDSIVDNR